MLTDRLKNLIEIIYSFKVSEQLLALKPASLLSLDKPRGKVSEVIAGKVFREKWNRKIKPVPNNRSSVKTCPWGIKAWIPELFISRDAESITWFYLLYEVPSPPQWRVRPVQSEGDGGADEEDEDEDEDAQSGSKADCADGSTSCPDNQLLGRVFTDLKVCVS